MGNLLRNATHYTDAGSITLTLDEHGFSVEDTGAGVPEEQRERIFMPFVRGSSSSGRGEGLGLGLAGEADLRGRGLERNPQRGGAARLPVRSFTRCCLTKNSPPLDPSLTAGFIPFLS